ncbi:MAG TPA: hypothetical protein DET40_09990 [Lentisphaeria bacterium]|nr:MAG: hypothetical protein A2X45_08775 [Lentisphaerae bacterium GWF2_50_93]HCE43866.1 hypothetical protein [Lentisphaeria bacterium]
MKIRVYFNFPIKTGRARGEPGFAKDRWIRAGGPGKGGLIAVRAKLPVSLIIVNAEYMEPVTKNQPEFQKDRPEKVKKALGNF